MRIVGVDPGRSGALALICGGVVLDVIDVPLLPDNSQVEVAGMTLCRWIESHLPIDLMVIENVQPMRGIGAGSQGMPPGNAFRFGLIAGELRMAFKCYGIPIRKVMPGVWKKYFSLLKSGKEDSRQKALLLCPGAEPWLKRMKDHNRSEAVLIGFYGLYNAGK